RRDRHDAGPAGGGDARQRRAVDDRGRVRRATGPGGDSRCRVIAVKLVHPGRAGNAATDGEQDTEHARGALPPGPPAPSAVRALLVWTHVAATSRRTAGVSATRGRLGTRVVSGLLVL